MPIQNVTATNNQYLASTLPKQQLPQQNEENEPQGAQIAQVDDTLEVSYQTQRLQAEYGIENAGNQREADLGQVYPDQTPDEGLTQETNNALTGIVNAAVPGERPQQGIAEQGVTENRTEQFLRRQQAEQTIAAERDTTNPNRRLDLTV